MQSDPRYDTSKVKQRRNSNNNNNSPERRSNETNEKRKKKNDFHYFIKTYVKSYPIYILLKLNVRAERYTDLSAIICSSRISDSDSGSGDGDRDDSNKWHGTTMTTNFRKRSNRTQFGQYITTFNFIMQIWMLGAHCARIFGTVIISFDSIHLLFSFFLTPCYLELPRECKLLRIQRNQNRNPQRSWFHFFNTIIGNVMHRHRARVHNKKELEIVPLFIFSA